MWLRPRAGERMWNERDGDGAPETVWDGLPMAATAPVVIRADRVADRTQLHPVSRVA